MSQNSSNLIILSLLLLLAINIVFLDIVQFSPNKQPADSSVSTTSATVSAPGGVCSPCQAQISDEVSRQVASKSAGLGLAISPTAAPAVPKEYYVPLGTGMTRSSSYDRLPGADVFVDTSKYPSIKQATFEVYLRNPTGNGSTFAKLYNVTDKHDVWFSEVSFEGGGSARREAAIQLEPGNKEYQVMLKSTLQYDVYVENARIKIATY